MAKTCQNNPPTFQLKRRTTAVANSPPQGVVATANVNFPHGPAITSDSNTDDTLATAAVEFESVTMAEPT